MERVYEIHIVRAEGLVPKDRSMLAEMRYQLGDRSEATAESSSDPFVTILMNKEIVAETAVAWKSLNPTWDERFFIQAHEQEVPRRKKGHFHREESKDEEVHIPLRLALVVKDKDFWSKDDDLGIAWLQLDDLVQNTTTTAFKYAWCHIEATPQCAEATGKLLVGARSVENNLEEAVFSPGGCPLSPRRAIDFSPLSPRALDIILSPKKGTTVLKCPSSTPAKQRDLSDEVMSPRVANLDRIYAQPPSKPQQIVSKEAAVSTEKLDAMDAFVSNESNELLSLNEFRHLIDSSDPATKLDATKLKTIIEESDRQTSGPADFPDLLSRISGHHRNDDDDANTGWPAVLGGYVKVAAVAPESDEHEAKSWIFSSNTSSKNSMGIFAGSSPTDDNATSAKRVSSTQEHNWSSYIGCSGGAVLEGEPEQVYMRLGIDDYCESRAGSLISRPSTQSRNEDASPVYMRYSLRWWQDDLAFRAGASPRGAISLHWREVDIVKPIAEPNAFRLHLATSTAPGSLVLEFDTKAQLAIWWRGLCAVEARTLSLGHPHCEPDPRAYKRDAVLFESYDETNTFVDHVNVEEADISSPTTAATPKEEKRPFLQEAWQLVDSFMGACGSGQQIGPDGQMLMSPPTYTVNSKEEAFFAAPVPNVETNSTLSPGQKSISEESKKERVVLISTSLDGDSDDDDNEEEQYVRDEQMPEDDASWLLLDSVKVLRRRLVNAIIRPARAFYSIGELGPSKFDMEIPGGKKISVTRTDMDVVNRRGVRLKSSLWTSEKTRGPVILYVHGNGSCRLEATGAPLTIALAIGASFCAVDTTGSGLSEGQYVSLGYYESDDVYDVAEYLKKTRRATSVALWGRSAGAVAALLCASTKAPILSAVVADSAFASLVALAKELVHQQLNEAKFSMPEMLIDLCLSWVAGVVYKRTGFDLTLCDPGATVGCNFVPTFFIHGEDDNFIVPNHSKVLADACASKARLLLCKHATHNSNRPPDVLLSIARWLQHELLLPTTPYLKQFISKLAKAKLLYLQAWLHNDALEDAYGISELHSESRISTDFSPTPSPVSSIASTPLNGVFYPNAASKFSFSPQSNTIRHFRASTIDSTIDSSVEGNMTPKGSMLDAPIAPVIHHFPTQVDKPCASVPSDDPYKNLKQQVEA